MLCQLELLARADIFFSMPSAPQVAPPWERCALALGSALKIKPCIRDARYALYNWGRTF